jgi:hypothetical protein
MRSRTVSVSVARSDRRSTVIANVVAGDGDDLRGFWMCYDDVDVQSREAAVGLGGSPPWRRA